MTSKLKEFGKTSGRFFDDFVRFLVRDFCSFTKPPVILFFGPFLMKERPSSLTHKGVIGHYAFLLVKEKKHCLPTIWTNI